MSNVKRVYVEKKTPYAVAAKELKAEIKSYLDIKTLTNVRVLIRYDIEDVSEETYKKALGTVFSEPPVDTLYEEEFPYNKEKDYVLNYLYGGITKWSVDPNKKGIITYKNALYNAGVLKQDIEDIENYVLLGAYEEAITYLANNNKSNTFYQEKLALFNESNT